MDNQQQSAQATDAVVRDLSQKIKGYRELSPAEINAMNTVKDEGAQVGSLLAVLESGALDVTVDKRWLAIARTELQQGFMALTRSIAKPDFF